MEFNKEELEIIENALGRAVSQVQESIDFFEDSKNPHDYFDMIQSYKEYQECLNSIRNKILKELKNER